MKHLWYYTIKVYVKITLFFLIKKINVYGKENIQKEGAVIYIGNHQNALIDALLIPAYNKRVTYFLARASAFKNKLANKILRSLNMLPVYRIRDGIRTIERNFEVFDQCIDILKDENVLEIFAEGEHHLSRRVIPLKKGFARIILATLEKYPELEIKIVPVGINFDSHLNYPCSASLYFGKPIIANDYIDVNENDVTFSKIINKVSSEMKKLTLHIENEDTYFETIEKLEQAGVNYLNPFEANKMAANIDSIQPKPIEKTSSFSFISPLHWLAKLNSIIPILIWRKLKNGINDVLFTNTFRFAVIATLFPLFYILQASIVYYFFNLKYAFLYLIGCVLLGIIATKTMEVSQ